MAYASLGFITHLDEILDYTDESKIFKFSPYIHLDLKSSARLEFTRDGISKMILGRDEEAYKQTFMPISSGTNFASPNSVHVNDRSLITDVFDLDGIDIGEFLNLLSIQNNSIPLKRLNVLISRSATYLNKTEKWIEYMYG